MSGNQSSLLYGLPKKSRNIDSITLRMIGTSINSFSQDVAKHFQIDRESFRCINWTAQCELRAASLIDTQHKDELIGFGSYCEYLYRSLRSGLGNPAHLTQLSKESKLVPKHAHAKLLELL